MQRTRGLGLGTVLVLCVVAACGKNDDDDDRAAGGATSTSGGSAGDTSVSGGTNPTDGGTGNDVASGGGSALGGSAGTSSASGGNTTTGGNSTTGGNTATAGAPATGGNSATGGNTTTAGAPSTGGNTATAGATSTGGNSAAAGAPATGGNSATGGTGESPTLEGCSVFPADNPWNTDVSAYPLHPDSDAFIDHIGRNTGLHPDFGTVWNGAPIGIPYTLVDSSTPAVPIDYTLYGDESDPGPFPIPPDAPIEGGPQSDGDRHVLVIDTDACLLYEIGNAYPIDGGASWEAGAGVVWDLSINDTHPEGCTSSDAAGLPIFPGLARYDEIVTQGELRHALRFTVQSSQRAYIPPASHYASSNTDPTAPPMGLRVRMKASYDCTGYSDEVQVICAGLKRYGMIVADNGSNWYISGAPDSRWNDDALRDLGDITGDAFEVVDTGDPVTDAPDCVL